MKHLRRSLPLFCLTVFLLAPAGAFARDLTGCWDNTGVSSLDNGICYMREAKDSQGNDLLFWNCRQTGQPKEAWANIAFGTIHKDGTIGLNWADDPQGTNRGNGTLTLKIESDNHLSLKAHTGGFGSHTWKRRASCP